MSYGTIVKELAKQLDSHIVAYDNLPQRGGCILYLDSPMLRVEVTRDALDRGAREVANFVRQLLAEPPRAPRRLSIGVCECGLVLLDDARQGGAVEPEKLRVSP